MPNLKMPDRETLLRLVRFLVVGGGTLGVQLVVFWALRHAGLSEMVTFTGSWIVSTGTHYLANRFWALPSARHDAAKQFGEYLFTIAVSWAINTAAFKGLLLLGVGEYLAVALAVPPSTVVVFLLLNYRVFRARNTPPSAPT